MPEGPFGDHTGFYTPVEPFPALTVDCMTMQRASRPIFQTIVVGRPPQEDGLDRQGHRADLPAADQDDRCPSMVDYDLPVAGGFHNCVIVSIDKRFPKHAQKVMNAIWGAGLMSLTKLIVIVDADCDVHDYTEVAWRAFGNVDYAHDLLATSGPVDHLDHALLPAVLGRQDRHRRHPQVARGGLHPRRWPPEIVMSTRRWPPPSTGVGRSTGCDHRRSRPRRPLSEFRPTRRARSCGW